MSSLLVNLTVGVDVCQSLAQVGPKCATTQMASTHLVICSQAVTGPVEIRLRLTAAHLKESGRSDFTKFTKVDLGTGSFVGVRSLRTLFYPAVVTAVF